MKLCAGKLTPRLRRRCSGAWAAGICWHFVTKWGWAGLRALLERVMAKGRRTAPGLSPAEAVEAARRRFIADLGTLPDSA